MLVTLAMCLAGAFAGATLRLLNATGSVSGAEIAVFAVIGAVLFGGSTMRTILRARRNERSQVSASREASS